MCSLMWKCFSWATKVLVSGLVLCSVRLCKSREKEPEPKPNMCQSLSNFHLFDREMLKCHFRISTISGSSTRIPSSLPGLALVIHVNVLVFSYCTL